MLILAAKRDISNKPSKLADIAIEKFAWRWFWLRLRSFLRDFFSRHYWEHANFFQAFAFGIDDERDVDSFSLFWL